eukprot:g288.t1
MKAYRYHYRWRSSFVLRLLDPVWVTASENGTFGFVGLFHSGEIARVSLLHTGTVTVVAKGLSCPEGVAVSSTDNDVLYVVENPVGDECAADFPLKPRAQLTRANMRTGRQYKIASLQSSHDGEEGGPHGLAVIGNYAYVCDCPADAASLTRVDLTNGETTVVTNLTSPSGCAVDGAGRFAYVVEQGTSDGQLVRVDLRDGMVGAKTVLLENLAGPMGVAVDSSDGERGFVYVEERHKNRVRRVRLSDRETSVFATGLNSPIGIAVASAVDVY